MICKLKAKLEKLTFKKLCKLIKDKDLCFKKFFFKLNFIYFIIFLLFLQFRFYL